MRLAALILGALLLIGLAAFYPVGPPRGIALGDTWQTQEPPRGGPAIGELGGVPVRIPEAFAHFVEYDGDPGLLDKRQGPVPPRTARSRIRSFGFEVRYPDMQGLSPETQAEHDLGGRPAGSPRGQWLNVTVLSGEKYRADHYLAALEAGLRDPKRWKYPLQKQPQPVHGLTAVVSQGGDPSDFRHLTLYTHHDTAGVIDTYIACHDAPHPAAPCTLHADLGPDMHAALQIMFRRELLPEWAGMQQSVTARILAFRQPA